MPEVKLTQGFVEFSSGDSTVKVALHGASVISWVYKGEERLFVSSKSALTGPAAIRGGIPIVFPCFGPPPEDDPMFSKLKQHGFARISQWEYAGEAKGLTNGEGITFSLEPSDEIKKLFEPEFKLLYSVIIESSGALKVILKVTNPSSAKSDLKYQTLLHTYIRLPSGILPKDVHATGLKGLQYIEKVGDKKGMTEETSDSVHFTSEVDRVYHDAPDTVDLSFGMKVHKSGYPSFVTWNPAKEKSDALGDMEADGWKNFVCIEPGQGQDWFKLAPGESAEASQTLEVTEKAKM